MSHLEVSARAARVRAGCLILAAVAYVPSLAAGAEPAEGLDELVVVATRSPVAPDRIGSSVSVITEQQIERSQAIVLADLLATTPGVAFSRNGGPGSPTAVRIRGAESDQTLVLIDGVQINDPASPGGGFDFGNLLVGDVERVEILRGPQSTLYGSQAIGGVINIVTREGLGRVTGNLSGETGSRDSSQFKAGVGGQVDDFRFRLGGARYRTDGVSAFAGGTETDPFRNTTFAGRAGYDFSPDLSIDVRGYYADGQSNYDGFPAPRFDFADEGDYTNSRQLVGYGGVNFTVFDGRLKNRVAYQSTDVDRKTYLRTTTTTIGTGVFDGRNRRWEYQGNLAIADGYAAAFGYQHERQELDSESAPTHASVGEQGVYLQVQGEVVNGLTLTAGARNDDHDTFGSHTTTQVAAAWSLASQTVLRASWGEGFKAPTLYQLFSDYRNPALQPEESDGFDAGIEQAFLARRVVLSATYFERDSRNLIAFASCPRPSAGSPCAIVGHSPFGYYLNTARARVTGVELQARFEPIAGLAVDANTTLMSANDRTPGALTFDQRLLRRPDTTANLEVAYTWPIRLETSVAARYTSSQLDSGARRLDAYTLVDLRASYPISSRLDVRARLENAFDETYQTVDQYGSMRRAWYAGLNYRF